MPIFAPHEYQEQGVKLLLEKQHCGLLLKPGMGKTSTTLAAISILLKKKLVKRVLILAPLRVVHLVWPDEISKWDNFNHLTYSVLHGPEKVQRINDNTQIHLMNYDGLLHLLPDILALKQFPYDMLVLDESSKMKSHTSKRFKALKKVLGKFGRRVILTGTPAPNGMLDLFSQCYCMDQGMSLGKFITHFRTEFFHQIPFNDYDWFLNAGAEEQIYKRIQHKTLHLSAEDYLKMPKLVETDVFVELPAPAMKQYKSMERLLMTQVLGGSVVAANAAVASAKCRQIANGFLYDNGVATEIHDAKLDAFEDLLEQLDGKPVLVFYEYTQDLERLRTKFPGRHIGGAVNQAQVQLLADWNDGKVPLLYAHPASAGHGLNMQHGGHNIIWFGPSWDMELTEQAVDRLYRQGQKNDVFVYRIMAKGTIDELIAKRLAQKDKLQSDLLSALRDYWMSK